MSKGYLCCKGCYDRHPLCHADCEKKAEADAKIEAIKKAKTEKWPIQGYSRERKAITERKRRNHRDMNKYNAKRVAVDGKKFDSRAEAEHYLILKDRQKRGEISGLECQRRFTIIEAQNNGRHRLQAVHYIADFVYYENGKMVVEDVKGYKKGVAYQLFSVKKKLMFQKYGIWVREI